MYGSTDGVDDGIVIEVAGFSSGSGSSLLRSFSAKETTDFVNGCVGPGEDGEH